ncbi:hypothetical protein AB733_15490 [Photobacterium swingsii]|uniref:Recombinase family protein n=1 Tax=Photobacterium swingsii TaxID=680026 RepID=A0A0J8V8Y4_9GAMM|nr:recombinase family protein [Photobacterium swingsii]KMV29893.1 hypothetical protein AB733_15490 [Photobacterium swingsii]PSW26020.1 recombinase family protein [Photobacterium swingsii]
MKLAAYIRVSSQNQVEYGDSLTGQEESIYNWAEKNGHTIVRKYIEPGSSAYNDNYRPQFNMMLKDIENDNFDCDAIIVYALSRFARNLISQSAAQSVLDKKSIRLLSVVEPLPEDYDTYRLLSTVIGLMNEMQSSQNSRTVCDRLQDTAEKGYFTGGNIPYGYESINVKDDSIFRKKLIINEYEAKIVRKIYKLAQKGNYGKGWGIKQITSYLNDNNILNRGNDWKINTIHRILNNSIYYGDRVFGKNRVKRAGKENPLPTIVNTPAIISKKLFDNVRDELKSRDLKNNKDKPLRSNSLLTGIVKCGKCNTNLVIRTGKGGKYKYYSCGKRIRSSVNSCTCQNIPKQLLEEQINEALIKNILTKDTIESILKELKLLIKANNTEEIELNRLTKKLKYNKANLNAFYTKLFTSEIEVDDTVKGFINTEQGKINEIQREIDKIKVTKKITYKNFGSNQVNMFVKTIKNLINSENTEVTKSFLIAMGLEVRVYPKN